MHKIWYRAKRIAVYHPTWLDRLQAAWFCLRTGRKVMVDQDGRLVITRAMEVAG